VNYGKWVASEKNTSRERLYEHLDEILRSVPGVESVAFTGGLPLTQEFNPWGARIEGREPQPSDSDTSHATDDYGRQGDTGIQWVNPKFFQTLKLRLLSGRFLEERDNSELSTAAWSTRLSRVLFSRTKTPSGNR